MHAGAVFHQTVLTEKQPGRINMLRLAALALASLYAAAATPALAAGDEGGGDEMTFRFQRYELETEKGAQALHKRLVSKAARLCKMKERGLSRFHQRCTADLANDWVTAIGDDRLTAIYESAS
jgi:UrcA family protein